MDNLTKDSTKGILLQNGNIYISTSTHKVITIIITLPVIINIINYAPAVLQSLQSTFTRINYLTSSVPCEAGIAENPQDETKGFTLSPRLLLSGDHFLLSSMIIPIKQAYAENEKVTHFLETMVFLAFWTCSSQNYNSGFKGRTGPGFVQRGCQFPLSGDPSLAQMRRSNQQALMLSPCFHS